MHVWRELLSFIKVLRWPIVILLLIGGLLYLNSALFNAWVSGGPPTPDPEIYKLRALKHLIISVVLFVLSGLSYWKLQIHDD
jgi:hypothetical protein